MDIPVAIASPIVSVYSAAGSTKNKSARIASPRDVCAKRIDAAYIYITT
jgi:hypothetical protein